MVCFVRVEVYVIERIGFRKVFALEKTATNDGLMNTIKFFAIDISIEDHAFAAPAGSPDADSVLMIREMILCPHSRLFITCSFFRS